AQEGGLLPFAYWG
nr:immunoglobulin heavy chain junction region [Mus musculus]